MKKAIYSSILGLLIIALGIFMWANPNAFVNILAFIFALYMLFDGFKALISFLKIRKAVLFDFNYLSEYFFLISEIWFFALFPRLSYCLA